MNKGKTTQEQKKLYNLYAIFGIALVASALPFGSAAIVSLVFFVLILVAAYMERGKAQEHSLVHNHAVYIIRTLWISAFVATLSMIAASVYMLGRIDYSPFQPCANTLGGLDIETMDAQGISEQVETIRVIIQPCVEPFITFNMAALMSAAVIGLAPPLVYILYRFFKGLSRAIKGYGLANPRSWL